VKIKTLRKQLSMYRSSSRLGTHWLVNAGLSEPRASLRSVEAWCREFAIDEGNPLTHTTVSQARDTFGQLLVTFNREDMTRYTDGSTHGFVLIRHLHDEATMRMRSQLPALAAVAQDPAAAPAAKHRHVPLRGRSSKIQNNVVTMHRSSSDQQLPVLIELQPLARKDAETLATSLRGVIDTGATAMAASTRGGRYASHPLFGRRWRLHKCRGGSLVVVMGGGRSSGSTLPPFGVHLLDARCELGRADCHLRRRAEYGQQPPRGYVCAFFQVFDA
jgi:hypothetical protein